MPPDSMDSKNRLEGHIYFPTVESKVDFGEVVNPLLNN